MKLLALAVLVYAAATSADLFGPGGLKDIGGDLGGRIGSGIGLGLGSVVDTGTSLLGFGRGRRPEPTTVRPVAPPPRPGRPREYPRERDFDRDRDGGRRRGPDGRREYDRRGSDDKRRDYSRELVNERERGSGNDSRRGGRDRVRAEGDGNPGRVRGENSRRREERYSNEN